jgi:hypothetical protein
VLLQSVSLVVLALLTSLLANFNSPLLPWQVTIAETNHEPFC